MKNDKTQNKKDNNDIEKLEYDIIGSAFLGSLLDMSGDLDNSGQNFAMYLETEQIKELNDELKKKDNSNKE
ncbi:MAG: hypothetical protein ACRC92_05505 [Peptostreptococcaceae bacterium]